jgi:hypothetical protein
MRDTTHAVFSFGGFLETGRARLQGQILRSLTILYRGLERVNEMTAGKTAKRRPRRKLATAARLSSRF